MANIDTTAMRGTPGSAAGRVGPVWRSRLRPSRLLPGVALCAAVTAAATALQAVETRLVGEPYLEALVLAILIGVAIRTAWTPGTRWAPGIAFSAKILLEIAVVGTVVKLVRVLMLGPVVLALSLLARWLRDEPDDAAPNVTAGDRPRPGRPALHELVPWFILGFLLVLALRSFGLIPAAALPPIAGTASLLTTVSMAALGLGVDVRVVARAGLRVTAAVTLSLVVLGTIGFGLIRFLGGA